MTSHESPPQQLGQRNFPVQFCYIIALMALAMATLPADAFAIFGGGITEPLRRGALVIAGIVFGVGLILHAILYRLNPAAFKRQFWSLLAKIAAGFAAMFAFSFVLARATGLPARVLQQSLFVGTLGLIVGGIALVIVGVSFIQRRHAGNRMARLIRAGDFAGAIRIGEDCLRKQKREYSTVFNLAMAYAQNGERHKAAELLPELEANALGQTFASPEDEKQLFAHLRAAIDPNAAAPPQPVNPTSDDQL
jgi:hypothetical protein